MTTSSTRTDLDMTEPRRRFLRASGWFDIAWYRSQVGDDFASVEEAIDHFLTVGARLGLSPDAALGAMQGGPFLERSVETREDEPPAADDPQLLREVALVAESGLFDRDFYASAWPSVAERLDDLLLHFCRFGWREAKQPSAAFDTWHYWSTHLDPAREGVNPLVHYILTGRAQGLSVRAEWVPPRPGTVLPVEREVRRACLFAAYDADGLLDESLIAYVRELARFADVYLLADCHIDEAELAKLADITVGAWAVRHGAYDFGSYSMLARDLVGWERLEGYDEVLLVNDSCYLLRPLDEVFAQMSQRMCDWWGLQATKGVARTAEAVQDVTVEPIPMERVRRELLAGYMQEPEFDFHIGSYFLAYRQPVIRDAGFRRILGSVHRQRGKAAIVHKYEIGLTQHLIASGYDGDTFIDALYPFQPVFTNQYFRLLGRGFPLLKKYFLYQNHYDTPDLRDWKARIRAAVPDAPVDVMERNLLRTAPDDQLQRSFAIVTLPDGSVSVPTARDRREFRRADRSSPTFDHWWAFAVSPDDGHLPPNARAIFEEVRDDPSIKKIILTRSRRIDLEGDNVVVAPVTSRAGQDLLMRAGVVLVAGRPGPGLGVRLDASHRVLAVRDGIDVARRSATTTRRPVRSTEDVVSPLTGYVAASDFDRTVMAAVLHPAPYGGGVATGLPADDFVLMPEDRLPADLARELGELRALVAGRRLLLLVPERRRAGPHRLWSDDLAGLRRWCEAHDAVVGIRHLDDDSDRRRWEALGTAALDVGRRHFGHVSVLYREASALLAERAGAALDFTVTGRPVVPVLASDDADDYLVDVERVMPSEIRASVAGVCEALDGAFSDGAVLHRYIRARSLFRRYVDASNAARFVHHVRRTSLEARC
ncbi:hypothetical protein KV102_04515 [Mumia sp. zg.B53]|uniref:rhamnan synthesis F family protein n=1 Tax=Mumia sp. zg.B53 TaxID=2855449 RepID=UPI001C6DD6E6|nr:rhamnan synthesis F family protein [Mumia sp. zg.B53]MBW9214097.1 hypothetical protein [Mumia sp. zg.B53]